MRGFSTHAGDLPLFIFVHRGKTAIALSWSFGLIGHVSTLFLYFKVSKVCLFVVILAESSDITGGAHYEIEFFQVTDSLHLAALFDKMSLKYLVFSPTVAETGQYPTSYQVRFIPGHHRENAGCWWLLPRRHFHADGKKRGVGLPLKRYMNSGLASSERV
jgi:hypothetical protein